MKERREKKHQEREENIREDQRNLGEGKEGRAEASFCSFVPLSLPSRSARLVSQRWSRGGCGRSGGADCPFTGVCSI